MQPVDRLNVYVPSTVGWVCMGSRYSRWWEPAMILGRVARHRRVLTATHGYVFIEHEQQFQLVQPWMGAKPYGLCRI